MPVAGNLDPIDSYQLMAAQNGHHLHSATNMVPISYSLAAGLNPSASYEATFMDNGQQISPQTNGYVITNADTLANQSTVPISPCSSQYGVFIAGTGIRGSLQSSMTNPSNIPFSSQQYSSPIPYNHNLYALSQQPPVYGTIPRRVRVIPGSVQQQPPATSLASSSSNSSSIHQSHGHQPVAPSSSNNPTGTISSISTSNSMNGNSAPGNGDVYPANGTTQSVTQV